MSVNNQDLSVQTGVYKGGDDRHVSGSCVRIPESGSNVITERGMPPTSLGIVQSEVVVGFTLTVSANHQSG
jgi:hypothetical protein